MELGDSILYLPREDVVAACAAVDTVAAVRDALIRHGAGHVVLPSEAYLAWTGPSGASARSLNMPVYVDGDAQLAGTKIINGCLANPARGLPRASGLTLLFDPETARVVAILEAAYISAVRTASVTVVAAQELGVPPVERAAVLGAGTIGAAHVELLLKRIDGLRRLALFDLDSERSASLRDAFTGEAARRGVELVVAESAREAIEDAALVIPATTTSDGYVAYDWLRPGSVVVNVSLDDVLPEVVLRADLVVVDDWPLVGEDDRRLLGRMVRDGLLFGPGEARPDGAAPAARGVDGELGDVLLGRCSRRSPDDVVLVNPFGMALEDIVVATEVYRRAREQGLGVRLPP